jgi:ribonucleoside-diphosphate reductase beta chain
MSSDVTELSADTVSPEELEEAAHADLRHLGDVNIDSILALIDEPPPTYRQLYYRWERQQWEVGAIDFTEDRRHWQQDFTPEMQRAFLWGLSSCCVGEDLVPDALVPFVDVAPTEEQQVFLTTQLADEARHTVFLDRFQQEVLDEHAGRMKEGLEGRVEGPAIAFAVLLLEMLPEAAQRIATRRDLDSLVEGVVLYHIVTVATVALTGQRFLSNYARREGLLPGFRQGFAAIARDRSRHVAFAIRFLKEMVASEPRFATVIQDAVQRTLPVAMSAMEPPDGDASCWEPLGYGPAELTAFGLNGLSKRLRSIGVEPPVSPKQV